MANKLTQIGKGLAKVFQIKPERKKPSSMPFDIAFPAALFTLFGIHARITGIVRQVTSPKSGEYSTYGQGDNMEILLDYFCNVVRPGLNSEGRMPRLTWARQYRRNEEYWFPRIGIFQYRSNRGWIPVNDRDLLELIRRQDKDWLHAGCGVRLDNIEICDLSEKTIKQWYADMKNTNDWERIEKDEKFEVFESYTAMAALGRKLEIEAEFHRIQTSAREETPRLLITATGEGNKLKIAWKIKESGFSILGFTRQGCFAANEWSETDNGPLVVSKNTSGETVLLLDFGKTYYFTFFLKSAKKQALSDNIRFTITSPPGSDVSRLENLIVAKIGESVPKDDTRRDRLVKILNELDEMLELEDLLEQRKQALIDDAKKKKLTEKELGEKIDRIEAIIEALRLAHIHPSGLP